MYTVNNAKYRVKSFLVYQKNGTAYKSLFGFQHFQFQKRNQHKPFDCLPTAY